MYRRSSVRSRSYSPPQRSTRSKSRQRSRSPSPSLSSPPPPQARGSSRPGQGGRAGSGPNRPPPRSNNPVGRSSNPPPPAPTTPGARQSRRSRHYPTDAYSPRRKKEVTLLLCIFSSTSHKWRTHPFTFVPSRTNDRELWADIRYDFRTELQKPWRRLLGFKRIKSIVPIAFSPNMVPLRTSPENFPASHQLVHAYHHPAELRPSHEWVDYLVSFDANDARTNGLEFIEGIWAEKLLVLAVLASAAIVIISIVWCVKGGDLQTVFTVMSFVLTLVAAQIALIALYYQIVSNDSPSGSSGGASADGGSGDSDAGGGGGGGGRN